VQAENADFALGPDTALRARHVWENCGAGTNSLALGEGTSNLAIEASCRCASVTASPVWAIIGDVAPKTWGNRSPECMNKRFRTMGTPSL